MLLVFLTVFPLSSSTRLRLFNRGRQRGTAEYDSLGSSNCRDRVPTAWVTKQASHSIPATEKVLPSFQNPNLRKVPRNPGKAALQQVHRAQQLLCEHSHGLSNNGLSAVGQRFSLCSISAPGQWWPLVVAII